jgi:ligand-binding sensor domain-containing protein
LSHDYVWVVYEDRQGTLWVGTDGGLNQFDPVNQTFTSYLHDPDDPNSLVSNDVRSLLEDSRGTFWVGTIGDGLHTMDRASGTFTRHRSDPENPTALSVPFYEAFGLEEAQCGSMSTCGGVSFIHEDQQGRLWVGGYGGGDQPL